MKDRIISIAVLLFAVSISVSAQQAHVTVHTREQMNRSASSLYSHTGDERWSRLEPVFAFDTLYPTSMCIPGDLPIEQSKARTMRQADARWQSHNVLAGGKAVQSHLLCLFIRREALVRAPPSSWTGKGLA
mgnify:CR=1 FL=1